MRELSLAEHPCELTKAALYLETKSIPPYFTFFCYPSLTGSRQPQDPLTGAALHWIDKICGASRH